MRKKLAFLPLLLALVCFACFGFAACGGNDNGDKNPPAGPEYTGLFTFVRDAGSYGLLVSYLDLADDGTFWYENESIAEKYCIGTYAYNTDKSKITLTGSYGLDYLDGEYLVEVKDNKVTIKDIYVLVYEGNKLTDNFTYDDVRTAPSRKPITVNEFIVDGDPDSYIQIKTEGKYELYVEDLEIMSSGSYTETTSGNTKTLTLTDELGEMENASFTFTYTYADGKYSNLVLKGTNVTDENGVKFTYERPTTMVLTGTAKSTPYYIDETVTVKFFADVDNEFELTFTTCGANPATISGTFENDYTEKTITFTKTSHTEPYPGMVVEDMVTSLSGTLDAATFMPTINISFSIPMGEAGTCEYTVALTYTLA